MGMGMGSTFTKHYTILKVLILPHIDILQRFHVNVIVCGIGNTKGQTSNLTVGNDTTYQLLFSLTLSLGVDLHSALFVSFCAKRIIFATSSLSSNSFQSHFL